MTPNITPARYRTIRRAAAAVLYRYGARSLPVDPLAMLRRCPFAVVMTFREFAEGYYDGDMEEMLADYGGIDGLTLRDGQGRYIVLINTRLNERAGKGRVRWTCAHELGHIELAHLEDSGEEPSPEETAARDAEADSFAGMLLAYPAVVKACGIRTARELAEVCGLSREAAGYRLRGLRACAVHDAPFDRYMLRQFHDFIHRKSCAACGVEPLLADARFCPMCGGRLARLGADGRGGIAVACEEITRKNIPVVCEACDRNAVTYADAYPRELRALYADARFCAYCGAALPKNAPEHFAYDEIFT